MHREARDTAHTDVTAAHTASFAACATLGIIGLTVIIFPEIWGPVYRAQPLIATVPFLLLAAALIWLFVALGYSRKQQKPLTQTESPN